MTADVGINNTHIRGPQRASCINACFFVLVFGSTKARKNPTMLHYMKICMMMSICLSLAP
jgi:hypothetical protein